MPRRNNESPSRNVEMVRAALQASRGNFGVIAECTGIPRAWLNQFSQGIFIDPGAARIETLARALGYEVRYVPVPPEVQDEALKRAAVRRRIHRRVYGGVPNGR